MELKIDYIFIIKSLIEVTFRNVPPKPGTSVIGAIQQLQRLGNLFGITSILTLRERKPTNHQLGINSSVAVIQGFGNGYQFGISRTAVLCPCDR